ncbi:MAG TPA: V-type ATPase subunit, partial [Gemmatimonadaceae bacterium]|nr:V-type ATPase subunit [Gemmatimonadaceae bacterium]
LVAVWADVCRRDATVWGDRSVRVYVSRLIDVANLTTARLLAEQRTDASLHELFVAGGAFVTADDLGFAARAHDLELIDGRLTRRGAPRALRALATSELPKAEDEMLDALVAEFVRRGREDPSGLAPVAAFFLRLRREQTRVLRAIGVRALGLARRGGDAGGEVAA